MNFPVLWSNKFHTLFHKLFLFYFFTFFSRSIFFYRVSFNSNIRGISPKNSEFPLDFTIILKKFALKSRVNSKKSENFIIFFNSQNSVSRSSKERQHHAKMKLILAALPKKGMFREWTWFHCWCARTPAHFRSLFPDLVFSLAQHIFMLNRSGMKTACWFVYLEKALEDWLEKVFRVSEDHF